MEGENFDIDYNERVVVAGQRKGTVRFIGETQFAPGILLGRFSFT